MSSEPKLNVSLKILKLAGHQIGDAHIPPSQDGHTMRVWIDGVSCTLEDVLKMVEEEACHVLRGEQFASSSSNRFK